MGIDGLISVSGGKWTTARMMGQKVVQHVVETQSPVLPPLKSFDSRRQPLSTSFGDYDTVGEAFQAAVHSHPGVRLPEDVRVHLARLYGTEHQRILDLVAQNPHLAQRLDPHGDCLDIAAQVVYAITEEAAVNLADVIDRRIVLGTLGAVSSEAVHNTAEIMADISGWSREHTTAQILDYLNTQQQVQNLLKAYR